MKRSCRVGGFHPPRRTQSDALTQNLEILSPAGKQVEQSYIMEQAAQRQISETTLRRAKRKDSILSIKRTDNNGNNHWFWKLSESDSNDIGT
jgi:hypothetical protein